MITLFFLFKGSMLRVQGSMLRVQGSMLRVQGSKSWPLSLSKCAFKVQCFAFKVQRVGHWAKSKFNVSRSIVQMFSCSNVRLFPCSNVLLFACSIVRLFKCSLVLLFAYSNVESAPITLKKWKPRSDVLSGTLSLSKCLPKQHREHRCTQSIVNQYYKLR